MVSISMYDIPFLLHMTSYMTCFGQIRMDQHQIWYSGVLGPTWVTKRNYICSDRGHNVDVLIAILRFHYECSKCTISCVCRRWGLYFAFRSLRTCTEWHLSLGLPWGHVGLRVAYMISADITCSGWALWLASDVWRSSVGVMSVKLMARSRN